MCRMGALYEQWQAVAAARPNATAVVDTSTGQRWSFQDLLLLGEATQPPSQTVLTARGRDLLFLTEVLRAWKYNVQLLPLDGDPPTEFPSADWLEKHAVAHLKQTSGSTGQAKLVAFTADQLRADVKNIVATMGLRHDWPNVGVISLAHSYGFSNLVLPLLLHGIPLLLGNDPLPATLQRALAGASEVTLPAVPAMWKAWRDTKVLTPQIKLAISAGAPLGLELETSIYVQTGLKVHNFYGSSECGGIAYDRTEVPRTQENLAGTAMDGVSLDVLESGRLEVASAAVGVGYWPEAHEDLEEGKFLTSDLVQLTPLGEVLMEGRTTEVINVAGRKVNPVEIEAQLQRHPAVKCCLVFGHPSRDASRCEDIVALVSLQEGACLAEIKSQCCGLASWQLPRHWQEEPTLAPDHRGKLSRAQWKARFRPPG